MVTHLLEYLGPCPLPNIETSNITNINTKDVVNRALSRNKNSMLLSMYLDRPNSCLDRLIRNSFCQPTPVFRPPVFRPVKFSRSGNDLMKPFNHSYYSNPI